MAERSQVSTHPLENGITLLVEEMPWVSSAALTVFFPMGAATDPAGLEGTSSLLYELMRKGAGSWNTRELSEQFESIGTHMNHSVGVAGSAFSAVMLPENLHRAAELLASVILEPKLPADELPPVQAIALQELALLEDEPASKVVVELNKQLYPQPFGRSHLGTIEGVNAITAESLRRYYQERIVPSGIIIGVAGRVSSEKVLETVKKSFGEWAGSLSIPRPGKLSTDNKFHHIERDTSQLQIALAYPSVDFSSDDYYPARVAASVLSGGMCGRLFIEVREKRGLVYRVSASHNAAKGRATLNAYAGTTPENGQECLDVMLGELRGLASGVEAEELDRAKADLKSRLVMQSEISGARSSALVHDWWNIGRVRSLVEIKDAVEAVKSEDIQNHLKNFPVEPVTLVTLGSTRVEFR